MCIHVSPIFVTIYELGFNKWGIHEYTKGAQVNLFTSKSNLIDHKSNK